MFVPFSVECYGAWGPAATSLFEVATAHLHNYRDTEFFHWSSAGITNYWATALGFKRLRLELTKKYELVPLTVLAIASG